MALFNRRKKSVDNVPAEVQEYYQAEKRERTGVAWLLALGTLLATVLLAIALFFGGRWLYRTIFNKDEPKTGQQQTENNGAQSLPGDSGSGEPEQTPAPATEPTPGQEPSQSTPGDTTTPSPTTTPTTTPRTGPEGPEETL